MRAVTGVNGGLPELVPPMTPSAGSGQPPVGPDWVVELAWTGHRCIAYVEPGRRTRLLSSGDVSMTTAYPELGPPLEQHSPPRGMILDGTIVARGEEYAARADRLRRRRARRPSEGHIRAVPVDFQVADLLWLDGHPTVDLPYRDRRVLLEGLGFAEAPVWTTSPLPVSELASMLRIADVKGVDALHARHLGFRYRPGGRSPLWVKVPVPRTRQVVVGGWTPTDPAHPERIASLLLGVPGPEGLRYVGRVGVAGDERGHIARLRRLRTDRTPFTPAVPADAARSAIWVAPMLVGLVEFTGVALGGRLRLPRWRGLLDVAGPDAVDDTRWAVVEELPPPRVTGTGTATAVGAPPLPGAAETAGAAGPAEVEMPRRAVPAPDHATVIGAATVLGAAGVVWTAAAPGAETRRLEQHFVYNALNTIASLIRTDPARARELLFGFADLSRAADQPGDATITLGRELEAVAGYLKLEQARFGARLRVELDVDAALHDTAVAPMRVMAAVRDAVQRHIEPRAQGGVLSVSAQPRDGGCAVTVAGGTAEPVVLILTGK